MIRGLREDLCTDIAMLFTIEEKSVDTKHVRNEHVIDERMGRGRELRQRGCGQRSSVAPRTE